MSGIQVAPDVEERHGFPGALRAYGGKGGPSRPPLFNCFTFPSGIRRRSPGDRGRRRCRRRGRAWARACRRRDPRSEEHTSELQSLAYLVCRLLLEKKKEIRDKHR